MGQYVDGVTLTGWGVLRGGDRPWHFVGLFPTKAEAEARARELGSDYEVRWGDNQAGTDNFVSTDQAPLDT